MVTSEEGSKDHNAFLSQCIVNWATRTSCDLPGRNMNPNKKLAKRASGAIFGLMSRGKLLKSAQRRTSPIVCIPAFIGTVAVFALAGLVPEGRVWGFNQWGYFPAWVIPTAALMGLVVMIPAWRRLRGGELVGRIGSSYSSVAQLALPFLPLLGVLLFYLLRSQIHLYGDGYLRLDSLATVNPVARISDFGATTVLKLLYSAVAGLTDRPALTAYRLASICGGAVFLTSAVLISRRIISDSVDRVLFVLALATGGYALLFFGYVENYTLFAPTVGVYTMVGMYVANGGGKRWATILPAALASFLHVFGLMLLPSLLYLLISGTGTAERFSRLSWKVRAVAVAAVGVGLIAGLYSIWSTSYFVRFSMLPIVANQFTVDGYTMFSADHLVDCLNLLMQLFPAALLIICLLPLLPLRRYLREPRFVFLSVLVVSSSFAVLIFNPQLGMPRDWDMFGFVGVPMIALGVGLIIRAGRQLSGYRAIVTLVIAVQVLALAPRVATQLIPSVAIAHAENWGRIDPRKQLYVYRAIQDLYRLSGQTAKATEMARGWKKRFVEVQFLEEGRRLMDANRYEAAAERFTRAIEQNPMFSPAYRRLGSCMLSLNRLATALTWLQIADGFNPGNPEVLNELGVVHASLGNGDEAERCWRQIIRVHKHDAEAALNLLQLYSAHHRRDDYVATLLEVATWPTIPARVHKLLGDYYRSKELTDLADDHYLKARQAGLDSAGLR